MTPEEIEDRIKEIFEQNYEMLKLEGGHCFNTRWIHVDAALSQVLYYYRKMRSVAERVTDTEVKLTLPDQLTPDGRRFTIEGIVDIVREDDEVWMYDIKTHDPDYISGNKQFYEKQLNVYAHIYENLRGNKLDHTAIISTAFPANMKAAIASGDVKRIEQELPKWNPLIDIPFDQSKSKGNDTGFWSSSR
jgi:ATP-dependent exoDNAse (exonuclease V) beta subunit